MSDDIRGDVVSAILSRLRRSDCSGETMKPIDDDSGFYDFELSTGRRFGAYSGIVGICQSKRGGWHVTNGYDGDIYGCSPGDWVGDESQRWTPAERRELADYMIAQWQAFKAANAESR